MKVSTCRFFRRIAFLGWALLLNQGLAPVVVSAQEPTITAMTSDGAVTWTNTSTDCVAVMETLSPATSGAWISVHAELPTTTVSQAHLVVTNEYAWFRTVSADNSAALTGMVLIPGGAFQMGNNLRDGWSDELPVHTVYVSPFYMERYEVTKALWDEVYGWAITNGYNFDHAGSGKGDQHPVHMINWYDCLKWCNARSEMEGLSPVYYTDPGKTNLYTMWQSIVAIDAVDWNADGYRLPTEAEWEKAARGGLNGRRFPWGDTIDHSRSNYRANGSVLSYDVSPYTTLTFHPAYNDGIYPYTSPVGSFAPNGYGLYDMTGNVWDRCWDSWGIYPAGPVTDPQGPESGFHRMLRGGSWNNIAYDVRCALRFGDDALADFGAGIRCVRRSGP